MPYGKGHALLTHDLRLLLRKLPVLILIEVREECIGFEFSLDICDDRFIAQMEHRPVYLLASNEVDLLVRMGMFIFTYDENDECYEEFDRSEHLIENGKDHITRYKNGKIVEKKVRRVKTR